MFHLSRLLVALLAFVLLVLYSAVALAADGDPQTAAAQLAVAAIEIIGPAVLVVLAYLARRAVRAFERRTDIDIPKEQEAQIDHWVEEGVRFAEKRGKTAAKHGMRKLKGPDKLEAAVDHVLEIAYDQGGVRWTRKRIEAKVEAYLDKLDGQGATS